MRSTKRTPDPNSISPLIHNIDGFLPGSQLPVMSSSCRSRVLSARQTGTSGVSPPIRKAQPYRRGSSDPPDTLREPETHMDSCEKARGGAREEYLSETRSSVLLSRVSWQNFAGWIWEENLTDFNSPLCPQRMVFTSVEELGRKEANVPEVGVAHKPL